MEAIDTLSVGGMHGYLPVFRRKRRDGASNVHHFPGTFYDYRWSTTLARRDKINKNATVKKASGPDGNGGLINVAGDYRELQGTMWAHDHRFFLHR
jgi:hypothetical protein